MRSFGFMLLKLILLEYEEVCACVREKGQVELPNERHKADPSFILGFTRSTKLAADTTQTGKWQSRSSFSSWLLPPSSTTSAHGCAPSAMTSLVRLVTLFVLRAF